MRKIVLILAAAAMGLSAAPAAADPPRHAPAHGKRAHEAARMYDAQGRYYQPRRLTRGDRIWQGNDGRYYCKRDNGTTGLIIGGAIGALVGREIDGGQDRTLGTIIGAAGGALLGREVDRGGLQCR